MVSFSSSLPSLLLTSMTLVTVLGDIVSLSSATRACNQSKGHGAGQGRGTVQGQGRGHVCGAQGAHVGSGGSVSASVSLSVHVPVPVSESVSESVSVPVPVPGSGSGERTGLEYTYYGSTYYERTGLESMRKRRRSSDTAGACRISSSSRTRSVSFVSTWLGLGSVSSAPGWG